MATLSLNIAPNTMTWFPINSSVGASLVYAPTNNGQVVIRSNATVAMTDTLPVPNAYFMPNGWFIKISNKDASAAITLSAPTGTTVNGASSITISALTNVMIGFDGANYWTI